MKVTARVIITILAIVMLFAIAEPVFAAPFFSKLKAKDQSMENEEMTDIANSESSVPEVEVTNLEKSENEDFWIYPEDVIDALEKAIGYRPEYTIHHDGEGQYMLAVTFYHLEIGFGWPINTDPMAYDGWRTNQEDFDLNMTVILNHYLEAASTQKTNDSTIQESETCN